jgi:hypothetical protein
MKTFVLSSLETFPYFTIEAVKQLVGVESGVAGTIQTALYRWMKAGHVFQLKKGVYMSRRFYDLHRSDANFASAVSAILIPQSYVSLEFILQRYGVLTEVTYPVSSVTFKHTRVIENKLGTFTFQNIKENLYQGFVISNYLGIPFSQATLAKAFFDYLYLHSWKEKKHLSMYNLVEDLRLNLEDFSGQDKTEFARFVETSKSRKMDQILENIRKAVWQL